MADRAELVVGILEEVGVDGADLQPAGGDVVAQRPWVVDGIQVEVEDVDAHFARAKAAGAVILSEPRDNPAGRLYRAEDPEGHRWMFIQPH